MWTFSNSCSVTILNHRITLNLNKPSSFEIFYHSYVTVSLRSVWYKTVYKGSPWDLFLSDSVVEGVFFPAYLYLSVEIGPYLIFSHGLALWKNSSFTGDQIARCMGNHSSNFILVVKKTHLFKNIVLVLAGVAQWIERQPVNQKVTSLIPSQGTGLGCGPGPWLRVGDRQPIDVSLSHQCFSLSFSLPSPSLKINK